MVFDPHNLKNPPLGVKLFQQQEGESDKTFQSRLTEWLVKHKNNLRIYGRDCWVTEDKIIRQYLSSVTQQSLP